LLVNVAGIGFRATAERTTDAQWDLTVAVNLTAVFRLCRLSRRTSFTALGTGTV
jgi:NAD(P)-dependent dehydrogenase (short-subunit alcohol dehydrogenase family)